MSGRAGGRVRERDEDGAGTEARDRAGTRGQGQRHGDTEDRNRAQARGINSGQRTGNGPIRRSEALSEAAACIKGTQEQLNGAEVRDEGHESGGRGQEPGGHRQGDGDQRH